VGRGKKVGRREPPKESIKIESNLTPQQQGKREVREEYPEKS